MKKKRIILTLGDPCGIGPEIAVKTCVRPELSAKADLILLGNEAVLRMATDRFVPEAKIHILDSAEATFKPGFINLLPSNPELSQVPEPGSPCKVGGEMALTAIDTATDACLSKQADAMVTAPVSKEAIEMTGIKFSGHTGHIAKRCGVNDEMMMMASPRIHVGYVTTHVPLMKVSENLSVGRVLRCLKLTHGFLQNIGGEDKPIALCGLNPHAGESGLFGDEENEILIPAVEQALEQDIRVEGPLPSDTLFVPGFREQYSAILSLYHDQGGIPFKMLSFDDGVNLTLGLPIHRTSVDHGTAWNLAWKGTANPSSMIAATEMAIRLCGR